MHIAQIGTGRVGRPTAYAILSAGLTDTLTVCDTKPNLAAAFAEELKHVTASTGQDVEITSCDKSDQVSGADIILISAGDPQTPGIKMTRRDLAVQNAKIIKQISETTTSRNRGAKYIVISNPVDAMAMVCKKYTKAKFVISTGTNLESLRFRSKLAESLDLPVSNVAGWVGGEHGDSAVPLWSTVRVTGKPYQLQAKPDTIINKAEVESYVKTAARLIIDGIGGTEYGPAASFRDITRAIVQDRREVLSIAAPMILDIIPETVFLGLPRHVGQSLGKTIYDNLSAEEKNGLAKAAKDIYQTYQKAIENLEKTR